MSYTEKSEISDISQKLSHPNAYCPHCGIVKDCVALTACSPYCEMVLAIEASREEDENLVSSPEIGVSN